MGMLIDVIAGARPNFIKISPILRAINQSAPDTLSYRLVHTGQHYDERMSDVFFRELDIPTPHFNLDVGGGSQAEQTAAIMVAYERLLLQEGRPQLCLVVGDVNSTLACALTAKKCGVLVAHVEAGIRSGDVSMPEEINRVVTDAITDLFFTTSIHANNNLRAAGVESKRIFFVGNTMIDTLFHNMSRLRRPAELTATDESNGFFLATLHRPSNVDSADVLSELLTGISEAVRDKSVILPVHPRTLANLENLECLPENVKLVPPLPYLEFIWLLKHCISVITDSGGVTEEATVLQTPCFTLRDTTERPETVLQGTNTLIGTDLNKLKRALANVFQGSTTVAGVPELWDGNAGDRIVSVLAGMQELPSALGT